MTRFVTRMLLRRAGIAGAITVFSLITTLPACAQRPAAPPRPTLVVFLTIDQMIPDYFARYGRQFTGGLRRLQAGGVL